LNFLNFHPILMQFSVKCSSLWVIDGPYIFCLYYFKKGSKRSPNFDILHIWKKIISSNFYVFFMNGLCWELSAVCQCISSIFYGFIKINLTESANFQNLKVFIFSSNFNTVFCKVFILMGYWCAILKN